MPVTESPLRNSVSPRLSARRVAAVASRTSVAASSALNSAAPARRTSGAISRRDVGFMSSRRSAPDRELHHLLLRLLVNVADRREAGVVEVAAVLVDGLRHFHQAARRVLLGVLAGHSIGA